VIQLIDPKAHASTVTNLAASSRFLSALGFNPVEAGTPLSFLPEPKDSPKPLAPDFDMLERNLELEDSLVEEPVKALPPSLPLLGCHREAIAVSCPECSTQLHLEEEHLEKEGPCPSCAVTLQVAREADGEVKVRAYRHD